MKTKDVVQVVWFAVVVVIKIIKKTDHASSILLLAEYSVSVSSFAVSRASFFLRRAPFIMSFINSIVVVGVARSFAVNVKRFIIIFCKLGRNFNEFFISNLR